MEGREGKAVQGSGPPPAQSGLRWRNLPRLTPEEAGVSSLRQEISVMKCLQERNEGQSRSTGLLLGSVSEVHKVHSGHGRVSAQWSRNGNRTRTRGDQEDWGLTASGERKGDDGWEKHLLMHGQEPLNNCGEWEKRPKNPNGEMFFSIFEIKIRVGSRNQNV